MPTVNQGHELQRSNRLFACSTPCCDVMDRPRELQITADPGWVAVMVPPGEVAMFTPFEVWRFYQVIEKAALASMYAPEAQEGYPRQLSTAQPPMTAVRRISLSGVGMTSSLDPTGCINRKIM